jgi:hypothetical protein
MGANGCPSFGQQALLEGTHSIDEDQLALGRIWRYGLAYIGVIERELVVGLRRRRVESFPRPLAGNYGHAAAEGIDFNSSVFAQFSLLSIGRTLTPEVEPGNESMPKKWRGNAESLTKAIDYAP